MSRTGRYVQKWLDDDRWDIPLAALSPDCATALGEAAANALATAVPISRVGALRARRPGADLRCSGAADVVALGRHADRRPMSTSAARSTICWTRFSPPPTKACCRWRRFATPAASRSISRSCTSTRARRGCSSCRRPNCMWRRLSAGGNLLCSPEVIERLLDVIDGGNARPVRNRQRRSQPEARRDRVRRHALADGFRCHRAEAARSLVPAAVRQQSDADVGVRCRDHRFPQRQRRRRAALRLQPRDVPAHEASADLAARRMGNPQPRRCSRSATSIIPAATGGISRPTAAKSMC